MPIYSYLCHDCLYEVDLILGHDQVEAQACPRCEEGRMSRLCSAPSSPRGSFGTTRRNSSGDAMQKFNFGKSERQYEQQDLDLTKKRD